MFFNTYVSGNLNKEQLHRLEEWSSNLDVEHEKFLTREGKDEMILLAERMAKRFPNAIQYKYNNETFYVGWSRCPH